MTPLGQSIDVKHMYRHNTVGSDEGYNVDRNMLNQDLLLVSTETILRARVAGAEALAIVLTCWPVAEQDEVFGVLLEFYQQSSSMLQQFLTATIVREWANEYQAISQPKPAQSLRSTSPLAERMVVKFFTYLQSDPPPTYYEMYLNLSQISNQCRNLLNSFISNGRVPMNKVSPLPPVVDHNGTIEGAFTLSMAKDVVGATFESLKSLVPKSKKKELPGLEEKRREVATSIEKYGEVKEQHDARVAAAIAGALIALRELPPKLNPVIRSVMNGVKVCIRLIVLPRQVLIADS
jgi:TATA-binding protein-associated factor